jgi:hypothetical protein
VDETCRFAWLTSAVGAGGHESADDSGTFSPRSGELSLCLLPPGAALEGELPEEAHSADVDGNNIVSFSEMLRVIQLYNAAVFGCASESEDGYAPASLMRTCPRHAADYAPQDWRLNLAELLRVVQIYNAGGYTYCVTSEDGFCPSQL